MTASPEYTQYVLELLEPMGSLTNGMFFGGEGFRYDGVQFAMVMGNTLYFCVDNSTREDYIAAGSKPFSYMTKKGRVYVKKYYSVPGEVIEDQDELLAWAYEAADIARKTAKKK